MPALSGDTQSSTRLVAWRKASASVLLDQVKGWCGDSRTKVTVKPVIDLNADLVDPGVRGARPDP